MGELVHTLTRSRPKTIGYGINTLISREWQFVELMSSSKPKLFIKEVNSYNEIFFKMFTHYQVPVFYRFKF